MKGGVEVGLELERAAEIQGVWASGTGRVASGG